MFLTALALVLVPPADATQKPAPGEVGKFRWPPASAKTLHYKATFTKERRLGKALEKAERAARKKAGLYAPKRAPKRRVTIGMEITLAIDETTVKGGYRTALGKHSLRLKVPKARKGSNTKPAGKPTVPTEPASALLDNRQVRAVWGLPGRKGEPDYETERSAVERAFEHGFQIDGAKGTRPEDLRAKFGDHLLPVQWTHPLPSWIGTLVHTMELGGEAVIEGKQILREGTLQLGHGYRNARVDGKWTKASAAGFTLKYNIQVEEFLAKERSSRALAESMTWVLEIDGVATYSFRDQAWEKIDETVRARPKKLTETILRTLGDEVFVGTIRIERARPRKGTGKSRRSRRK